MDTPEAIFVCNGERLTPIYYGEDIYYVDIPDISPDALDETFTVFVNGSLEISYSVLNYVKDAVASSNGSLVQLAMSLYNFHVSSRAYSDVY